MAPHAQASDKSGYWKGWTNNREFAGKMAEKQDGSLVWAPDFKLWQWHGPWPGTWELLPRDRGSAAGHARPARGFSWR